MGAATINELRRIKGRLWSTPTDLTGSSGTALGTFGKISARFDQTRAEIRAEEYQGQIIEVIEGTTNLVVGCNLRDFDADALGLIFPSTATGKSGEVLISQTYTTERGALGSATAIKLLFVPDAVEAQQALYIPLAVPLLVPQAELAFSLDTEWVVPTLWRCLPDGTGRLFQLGILADMTI